MSEEGNRVGIFVCHCGTNIGGTVDVEKVAEMAKDLPNVVGTYTNRHTCSVEGQEQLKKAIEADKLDSIVVAACSPAVHEQTFRIVANEAGLNPYMVEIANIREHASWVHSRDEETDSKAFDLVKSGAAKAAQLEPLEVREIPVEPAAMVIGGGVAGIQAALDLADAGQKVYMIEKEASIGGNMAKLDKVFPTLDCSACILTPKMNTVGQHPNIELITMAEVTKVDGSLGNFTVTVNKKPRFIHKESCTSCGTCASKCPTKKIPNEFNHGLSNRTSIYKPFDTAVPASFVIDPENCLYLTKGVCQICEKHCAAEAINWDDKEEDLEIKVGVIVVATGYSVYEPTTGELEAYGYGRLPNVFTQMQVERSMAPNGPTDGHILRPSDGKEPKSIAMLSCVGSRDDQVGAQYCSRVCCMINIKNAMLIKEHWPDTKVTIFYMDLRTFGKGYEEMQLRAREMGIQFVRSRVAEVEPVMGSDNLRLMFEDTLLGMSREEEYEMVVLSTALRPSEGTTKLSQTLRVACGGEGFFIEAHPKLKPIDSKVDGVYLAGACQYPKDIPDAVSQGSGAAARALLPLSKGVVEALAQIATVKEEDCSGCGICEAVCPFTAITAKPYGEDQQRAHIDPAVCKGCGVCVSACPTSVIKIGSWEQEQILGQLDAILEVKPLTVEV